MNFVHVLWKGVIFHSKTSVPWYTASLGMHAALQPLKLTSHHGWVFQPSSCSGTVGKASSALSASLSSEFTVGWLSWQQEQTLSIWTKTVAMETKFYFLLIILQMNVWAFVRFGLMISCWNDFFFLGHGFCSLLSERGSFQEPCLRFYTLICSFSFTGTFIVPGFKFTCTTSFLFIDNYMKWSTLLKWELSGAALQKVESKTQIVCFG